jgi:hypothetical protein
MSPEPRDKRGYMRSLESYLKERWPNVQQIHFQFARRTARFPYRRGGCRLCLSRSTIYKLMADVTLRTVKSAAGG